MNTEFYNIKLNIPKKMDSEEALNSLENAIYKVAALFFETIGEHGHLTDGKYLRGNGHHMAQQISTESKKLWLERLEDKPAKP